RVLGDLVFDDPFVRLHDLVREREASARKHLGRAFDVGEHDRHGAFALTRGEAADDGLGSQRLRRVDGLTEAFGDRFQKRGVGTETSFTLRILDELQKIRPYGLTQLAPGNLFAYMAEGGVVARFQLGAFKSLG